MASQRGVDCVRRVCSYIPPHRLSSDEVMRWDKNVAKSNSSTLRLERLSEPRHGVEDNASEHHESPDDCDKQHKYCWAIWHTPVGVETLHYVHGQRKADADEKKARQCEGKQRPLKLDVAEHADKYLRAVGDGMLRGLPDIIADANIDLFDPQLGLGSVHKKFAIDSQTRRAKLKDRCNFH